MRKLFCFKKKVLLPVVVIALGSIGLSACGGSSNNSSSNSSPEEGESPVVQGQDVFRHDTFGNETFWTDALRMNEVIEGFVDPLTAASVGLKIDIEKLPSEVVEGVRDGDIPLNDPQTTLALLSLDAVVGAKAKVSKDENGKLHLDRFGITCALCHSTVTHEKDTLLGAGFSEELASNLNGVIGRRLDGWSNRDLKPGSIISLSPALEGDPRKAEYGSWATGFGPGFYDPRININVDPASNPGLLGTDIGGNLADYKNKGGMPVVIPAAFGLKVLDLAIFTGDGDTAHEPVGPVAYWNRYVAVTQMQGHGTFQDPRLVINGKALNIDHTNAGSRQDRVTPVLSALQAYQYSIDAPNIKDFPAEAKARGLWPVDDAAAARGKLVFEGPANCSQCHNGPALSDDQLHESTVANDIDYLKFSATGKWRASPLKGIWTHAPYFHDGSAETLQDVVIMYNDKNNLGLAADEMDDLAEYLKTL